MTSQPPRAGDFTSPTTTVIAHFDGDGEMWWCDEAYDGARTDITGGQVVGEVPLALWQQHATALDVLHKTRAALSDALGLHPTDMRFAAVCDTYNGESVTYSTQTFWHDCDTCGWPKEDHR